MERYYWPTRPRTADAMKFARDYDACQRFGLLRPSSASPNNGLTNLNESWSYWAAPEGWWRRSCVLAYIFRLTKKEEKDPFSCQGPSGLAGKLESLSQLSSLNEKTKEIYLLICPATMDMIGMDVLGPIHPDLRSHGKHGAVNQGVLGGIWTGLFFLCFVFIIYVLHPSPTMSAMIFPGPGQ